MTWYYGEDAPKSVTQVVFEVSNPQPIEPKFPELILGSKYHWLRTNEWVAGFFRMEGEKAPYLLLRADRHTQLLRGHLFRVAFCFYKLKRGGAFALFLDYPRLKMVDIPSGPFVLFEMIKGLDPEDEPDRIYDAIQRPDLHICFVEGSGSGQEFDGIWTGTPIRSQYDIRVDIQGCCRQKLNEEWASLLNHHNSLVASGMADFDQTVDQLHAENPLSRNPIIENPGSGSKGVSESNPKNPKTRWKFW